MKGLDGRRLERLRIRVTMSLYQRIVIAVSVILWAIVAIGAVLWFTR